MIPSIGSVEYLNTLAQKHGHFPTNFARKIPDNQQRFCSKATLMLFEHPIYWLELNEYQKSMINLRGLCPDEVVWDFDGFTEPQVMEKLDELKKTGINFAAYFTGSKGVHVHAHFPELKNKTEEERHEIRLALIVWLSADKALARRNVNMIAIEGRPHFKTGKNKIVIRDNNGQKGNVLPTFLPELLKQTPTFKLVVTPIVVDLNKTQLEEHPIVQHYRSCVPEANGTRHFQIANLAELAVRAGMSDDEAFAFGQSFSNNFPKKQMGSVMVGWTQWIRAKSVTP